MGCTHHSFYYYCYCVLQTVSHTTRSNTVLFSSFIPSPSTSLARPAMETLCARAYRHFGRKNSSFQLVEIRQFGYHLCIANMVGSNDRSIVLVSFDSKWKRKKRYENQLNKMLVQLLCFLSLTRHLYCMSAVIVVYDIESMRGRVVGWLLCRVVILWYASRIITFAFAHSMDEMGFHSATTHIDICYLSRPSQSHHFSFVYHHNIPCTTTVSVSSTNAAHRRMGK